MRQMRPIQAALESYCNWVVGDAAEQYCGTAASHHRGHQTCIRAGAVRGVQYRRRAGVPCTCMCNTCLPTYLGILVSVFCVGTEASSPSHLLLAGALLCRSWLWTTELQNGKSCCSLMNNKGVVWADTGPLQGMCPGEGGGLPACGFAWRGVRAVWVHTGWLAHVLMHAA